MLQITIDQSGIEEAIRKHIGELVQVNPGQEVSIELKAGRGENGHSAVINIGKPAAEPAQNAPNPGPEPTRVVRRTKPTVVPETTSEPLQETSQASAEPEAGARTEEPEDAAEETPDAAPPAAQANSLFGNLGRKMSN